MDDARDLQRHHDALLAQWQETSREYARKRLQTDPDSLTDYDRGLLGDEWRAHVRRRDAARAATMRKAAHRATVTRALCPAGIQFRNDRLQRLNRHAIDLVTKYGLTVKRSTNSGGWASWDTKTICVPAVTSEEHYAVCLHEIGHCVSPDADSRQYRSFIEDGGLHAAGGEIGAWVWSVKHALVWTRAMHDELHDQFKIHPAFRAATADDRGSMAALLTTSCLRIADRPWTFGELESARAVIERATA